MSVVFSHITECERLIHFERLFSRMSRNQLDLRVGETCSGEVGQQSVSETVRMHSLDAGRFSISRREELNPSRREAFSATRFEEVSLARRRFHV